MDPIVDQALRPAVPGPLVTAASLIHRGAAITASQIRDYSQFWRDEAENALAADAPVLVGFGDSLTQGIGASAPEGAHVGAVRVELQRRFGKDVAVLNLSRSGGRIRDVIDEQLPALVASGVVPAVSVCTVGSNDLLRSTRPRHVIEEMEELIGVLPSPTLLATVPGSSAGAAGALNRALRRRAAEAGVPVAEVAGALGSWAGKAAEDRFHPNDTGYATWNEQFTLALDLVPGLSNNNND